jgi:lysine 2,3-aminomutase
MDRKSREWQKQITDSIRTADQLEQYMELTGRERAALESGMLPAFAVTPHYATLLGHDAIRRTVIPTDAEFSAGSGELADPLGEEDHRVTPHLIHTYPDKVLFLATPLCPVYCRYCTRSRLVGRAPRSGAAELESSFAYIESHPEIRDVLISGGDPLIMTDAFLDRLLARIRSIPHVRMVRIGSKVPAVLPSRVTEELCDVLRRHRVWLSLHFIHAAELSAATRAACRRLADRGIAMVSQTVLLKGVNDDIRSLTDLFYGLLEINVKPYYLLQCDPVKGSAHFRTPVAEGIELIRSLHGRISGLAVPQYVIDAPGGGGKVPILSMDQIRREGDEIIIQSHDGREYRYPDPVLSDG